jgi:glycerol-3-phosphate acyltransferase PlsY
MLARSWPEASGSTSSAKSSALLHRRAASPACFLGVGLATATALLRTGDRGEEGPEEGGPDPRWLAVPAAFAAGSIPFSYLAARAVAGVDLREVGSGTVSGSGLFKVAGFGPLAAAGILEVAKGAVGPAIAGRDRPVLAALASAAGVAGHNWSPLLRGAGGRGISPAIGALLVTAPAGAAALVAGLAGGRLVRQTALGSFISFASLLPLVRLVHGPEAAWPAAAVLVVMVTKRLAGNARPAAGGLSPYIWRLLYDRDTRYPGPRQTAQPSGVPH